MAHRTCLISCIVISNLKLSCGGIRHQCGVQTHLQTHLLQIGFLPSSPSTSPPSHQRHNAWLEGELNARFSFSSVKQTRNFFQHLQKWPHAPASQPQHKDTFFYFFMKLFQLQIRRKKKRPNSVDEQKISGFMMRPSEKEIPFPRFFF